ncbi:hypothetical protein C8J56DRAFT_1048756 [Mycena floridula]|nr:hypothetical protein C8J56DRAFT_1048756 [Mycena floridula]
MKGKMTERQRDCLSAVNSAGKRLFGSPDLIEVLDPKDWGEYRRFQKKIEEVILQNTTLGPELSAADGLAVIRELKQEFPSRLVLPDHDIVQYQRRARLWFYVTRKHAVLTKKSLKQALTEEDSDEGQVGEEGDNIEDIGDDDKIEDSEVNTRVLPKRKARPTHFTSFFQRGAIVQLLSGTQPARQESGTGVLSRSTSPHPRPAKKSRTWAPDASIIDAENRGPT